MESKTITVTIPATVEKAVREEASAERRSLSKQIWVILEDWLERKKKAEK